MERFEKWGMEGMCWGRVKRGKGMGIRKIRRMRRGGGVGMEVEEWGVLMGFQGGGREGRKKGMVREEEEEGWGAGVEWGGIRTAG